MTLIEFVDNHLKVVDKNGETVKFKPTEMQKNFIRMARQPNLRLAKLTAMHRRMRNEQIDNIRLSGG